MTTLRVIFSPKKFLLSRQSAFGWTVHVQAFLKFYPPFYGNENVDIPDLDLILVCLIVLFDVDVYGEMCIDISHLVSVTLCDANDHVVDDGPDCP
jgi:hypothetical protein